MKESFVERTRRLKALREAAERAGQRRPERSRSSYPELGLDHVLIYGKHSGSTIEDVLGSDPGWVRWAIDNVRDFNASDAVLEYLNALDDPRRPQRKIDEA